MWTPYRKLENMFGSSLTHDVSTVGKGQIKCLQTSWDCVFEALSEDDL